MLKNISEVEKSLGLEEGKLKEMITSEDETSVNLEERVFFSKEDYDARIRNISRDKMEEGRDFLLKDMKEAQGLEYDGRKNPDLFIKFFKEKIEAESKIAPEEKYKKLKDDFDAVQKVSQEFQNKFTNLQEEVSLKSKQSKIDNILLKSIPDNTNISKNDVLYILKAKHNFNLGEDGLEIIKDGIVQKNETTRNLVTPDEYMKSFIKPYLKEVKGGKGGNNEPGNLKAGSFEAFEKEMESKNATAAETSFEMQKRIKEGTLKM